GAPLRKADGQLRDGPAHRLAAAMTLATARSFLLPPPRHLDLQELAKGQAGAERAEDQARAEQQGCIELEGPRVSLIYVPVDGRQDDRLAEPEEGDCEERAEEPDEEAFEHERPADEPVQIGRAHV